MREYENKNRAAQSDENGANSDNFPDLGSASNMEDFDPFGTEDDFSEDIPGDESTDTEQDEPKDKEKPANTKTNSKADAKADKNPMEAALDEAENTDAEKAKVSLLEKPPVFEYAGASENIEDTSKTFEELRIEKSNDFPELEDGKRVSWTVEYGKVTKQIANPKDMSIAHVNYPCGVVHDAAFAKCGNASISTLGSLLRGIKEEIEKSKEFLEALKKAKDKNAVCKLKPRVTAQSKGVASYKGVFTTVEEAEESGKIISIVPAKDGKVYEIRNTEMGKFITPTSGCEMLSNVRAGFIPALPLIPMEIMMKIVAFFRYYMENGIENEVLLNVYWDKENYTFQIDAPEQTVSKASVESRISEKYDNERYIFYMEIHSHNSMKAFFSAIDDNDEKATRLYTVIGNLHHYFPDVRTRISNGGKFWQIDPATVFELVAMPFPQEWKENVHFRSSHSSDNSFLGGGCA